MTANQLIPNKIYTDNQFSVLAFISAYIANGYNATQAVIEAGYHSKAPDN